MSEAIVDGAVPGDPAEVSDGTSNGQGSLFGGGEVDAEAPSGPQPPPTGPEPTAPRDAEELRPV